MRLLLCFSPGALFPLLQNVTTLGRPQAMVHAVVAGPLISVLVVADRLQQ
jgi:hypothetical protein